MDSKIVQWKRRLVSSLTLRSLNLHEKQLEPHKLSSDVPVHIEACVFYLPNKCFLKSTKQINQNTTHKHVSLKLIKQANNININSSKNSGSDHIPVMTTQYPVISFLTFSGKVVSCCGGKLAH